MRTSRTATVEARGRAVWLSFIVRCHTPAMKLLHVLSIGSLAFVSACSTPREDGWQLAYEGWLCDGTFAMKTLHTLEAGDAAKAKKMMTNQVLITLHGLQDFIPLTDPTPEQREQEILLAREILAYMLRHREDFDPRLGSVRLGVAAMKRILIEPDDVAQLTELEDYLAGVARTMSQAEEL